MGRWAQAKKRGSVYTGQTGPGFLCSPIAASDWSINEELDMSLQAAFFGDPPACGADCWQMELTVNAGAPQVLDPAGLSDPLNTEVQQFGDSCSVRVRLVNCSDAAVLSDWSTPKVVIIV